MKPALKVGDVFISDPNKGSKLSSQKMITSNSKSKVPVA
jgi:hypothetical protein